MEHDKHAATPRVKDAAGSASRKSEEALQTSEFELVEETEKPDMARTSYKTPVSAINVRSFKLLELLRKLEGVNAQDQEAEANAEKITTVRMFKSTSAVLRIYTFGHDI